jgi:hypothetical protein
MTMPHEPVARDVSTAIRRPAPAETRGRVVSTYFVFAYVGLIV